MTRWHRDKDHRDKAGSYFHFRHSDTLLSNFSAFMKMKILLALFCRQIAFENSQGRVSELASGLNVSVKTIETHQRRMKEKLGLHSAAELRQKAREWLARSAVNRIREEPESEQANGARSRCF